MPKEKVTDQIDFLNKTLRDMVVKIAELESKKLALQVGRGSVMWVRPSEAREGGPEPEAREAGWPSGKTKGFGWGRLGKEGKT